jgi:pheromone shutdown-related protein TraB
VSEGEGPEQDVHTLEVAGRTFVLVGTAHVSRESAELVRRIIERERPDRVCVELDPQRYRVLTQKQQWESLDLKRVIRQKQLPTLLVNLMLASYQKRLGGKLGVLPGAELLEATRVAEELGIPVSLCDRDVRVTMLRAWRALSFWNKNALLATVLAAMFERTEISEEELRRLRQKDALSEMMNELAAAMPALKRVLIDERDGYLAQKLRESEGGRIVAVVGAGHVEGVRRALLEGRPRELSPLETVPRAAPVGRWLGWAVPVVIVGALGLVAWTKGGAVAQENLVYWVLVTGIPSGIGAVLAAAHPLTILSAVLAAPITGLHPLIGAGYVTALVQAYVRPPLVRDLQSVSEEIARLRCWWSNRLLRVFLAFVLPSLGAMIGVYLGGYEILSSLLR